jgi:hypothetical protein
MRGRTGPDCDGDAGTKLIYGDAFDRETTTTTACCVSGGN